MFFVCFLVFVFFDLFCDASVFCFFFFPRLFWDVSTTILFSKEISFHFYWYIFDLIDSSSSKLNSLNDGRSTLLLPVWRLWCFCLLGLCLLCACGNVHVHTDLRLLFSSLHPSWHGSVRCLGLENHQHLRNSNPYNYNIWLKKKWKKKILYVLAAIETEFLKIWYSEQPEFEGSTINQLFF